MSPLAELQPNQPPLISAKARSGVEFKAENLSLPMYMETLQSMLDSSGKPRGKGHDDAWTDY